MDLKDLTHDEALVLIGLEKAVIQADKEFSEEEATELKKLAREMGTDRFKALVAEAKSRFSSLEDVKTCAQAISRQEARELIFKLLYDMALPGDVVPQEKRVLYWLSKQWQIADAKILPEPAPTEGK